MSKLLTYAVCKVCGPGTGAFAWNLDQELTACCPKCGNTETVELNSPLEHFNLLDEISYKPALPINNNLKQSVKELADPPGSHKLLGSKYRDIKDEGEGGCYLKDGRVVY